MSSSRSFPYTPRVMVHCSNSFKKLLIVPQFACFHGVPIVTLWSQRSLLWRSDTNVHFLVRQYTSASLIWVLTMPKKYKVVRRKAIQWRWSDSWTVTKTLQFCSVLWNSYISWPVISFSSYAYSTSLKKQKWILVKEAHLHHSNACSKQAILESVLGIHNGS